MRVCLVSFHSEIGDLPLYVVLLHAGDRHLFGVGAGNTRRPARRGGGTDITQLGTDIGPKDVRQRNAFPDVRPPLISTTWAFDLLLLLLLPLLLLIVLSTHPPTMSAMDIVPTVAGPSTPSAPASASAPATTPTAATTSRDVRIHTHSHIKGLGLAEDGSAAPLGQGFVGQKAAREVSLSSLQSEEMERLQNRRA